MSAQTNFESPVAGIPVVQVIMASFNRRESTVRCLDSLASAAEAAGVGISVRLVDASSPDGTAEAVGRAHPEVVIDHVASSTYWAAAMRLAWKNSKDTEYDYLMWLNDDVDLDVTAFSVLIREIRLRADRAIIVGATRDRSGNVTYSAYKRTSRLFPLRMRRIEPSSEAQSCDLFNGNIVLVSKEADLALGGFPAGYTHALADMAYGFAAARSGVPTYLAPATLGVCEANAEGAGWQKGDGRSARSRWEALRSPKGLPFRPWFHYCTKYGGATGALVAIRPYLRVGVAVLFESVRPRGKNAR